MKHEKIISQLIEMLNENNKIPYLYFNEDEIDNLIIYSVKNKNDDFLFNILNLEGKTPNSMSVNWRTIQHITQDIQENYKLNKIKMPKLSKTKSFSVSDKTIEVDFQGTICEVANLLRSGITNQTIILVAYNNKWHEINVLNLGGDDSNLQGFKNFIEKMKLSLVDLGITAENINDSTSELTHKDFVTLSEKYPIADYIEISLLNNYNVRSGLKSSINVLADGLTVITRDGITVQEYIEIRENNKSEIINKSKIMKLSEVKEIEVVGVIVLPEVVLEEQKPVALAKKPISLQVFETLTPERISELQGLNENQLVIVKNNPVIQITDKSSYELAKKTAATLLKASTAIDGSTGIEATATKYLNTFKNMLKNALQPIAKLTRDPYDEQKTIISAWENAELLKQQAIEREKLQRIKKRTDELFAVPFTFNGSIYSIGTVYCTPSQVETATDEDFLIVVNNGKVIKQALDAEALVQSAKDQRIAELEAKLAKLEMLENMSNTEPEPERPQFPADRNEKQTEMPPNNQVVNNPVKTDIATATTSANNTLSKPAATYVLPAPENELLNRLDMKNIQHIENPNYLKCRGYYVQALKDTAGEIEFILNDTIPNPIKKSERIGILCEILKKSM